MTDEPDEPLEVPPTPDQPETEPDHLPEAELSDDDPNPEVVTDK